jgi:hypothetical protein
LVLVQTLDDVDLIRQALVPTRVAACPYGYDPAIFDPRAPDLPRTTDVGCYLNLRDNPQRIGLVETASRICRRRGWTFGFVEGKYWHDYAAQIRTTKICLHRSVYREVPYRMYETMALGALFLTDPLQYSVDRLFRRGTDYVTYTPDLSDLEDILHQLLSDRPRWESIRTAGRQQVRQYTWTEIAETYVAPALRDLIRHRA